MAITRTRAGNNTNPFASATPTHQEPPAPLTPQTPPVNANNMEGLIDAQTTLVLTMMAQVHQMMVQQHENFQQQVRATVAQQTTQQHQNMKLSEFLRTRPSNLAGKTTPVESNDWLHSVERKLIITHLVH